MLVKAGHNTALVTNSRDVIERDTVQRVEVVIVNSVPDHEDLLPCLRRLKDDPRTSDIPVLLIASQATDIAGALTEGIADYVIAPCREQEILLRVAILARRHRERVQVVCSNEAIGEHARVMTILVDFSRRLSVARGLDAVLDEIVSVAGQVACGRRVSVMLPDSEHGNLTTVRCLGLDGSIAADLHPAECGAVPERVFVSGEQWILSGAIEAPLDGENARLHGSTPFVCKPLKTPDGTIGVLNISGRQIRQPFSELDLEYIDLVAGIAAATIHDALTRQSLDVAHESIVMALAKLAEYRDNDTGKHLERVVEFSLRLAEQLRRGKQFGSCIDDGFLADLKRAMPLHDIGKVAVPDHILLKPGKLTPEEFVTMRAHAQIGADTIASVVQRVPGVRFLAMAEEIALSHHEWVDGSGYPRGLRGDDIPLAARMAAVADVYDALTSKRPYKDAFPHERAVSTISKSRGSQFDPTIVTAFLSCEQKFAQVATQLADDAANDA